MTEAKPKRSKKMLFPIIMAVILIVGGIFGFKKWDYARHHESTDDAQFTGNINPISPRVSGYVTQLRVDDYLKVNKGDTMVVLDDRDLKIKVAQSEAALEDAKAALGVTEANVSASQSGIATATDAIKTAEVKLDQAQTDYNRTNSLYQDKAITKQAFDNAQTALDAAKTDLQGQKSRLATAQKNYDATNESIKVGQAGVAQREADLDYAKLQLSYAYIIAPVSGIVSEKNVQPGQLVQIGQPLFAIVDSSVWVLANFKETQVGDMKVGQNVEVDVDAFSGKPLQGKVADFSAATGAKFALLPPDNATGNFVKIVQRVPVKIVITGGDQSVIKSLRPGMSVSVSVTTND